VLRRYRYSKVALSTDKQEVPSLSMGTLAPSQWKNRESPENVNNNMVNAPFAVISIHYLLKVPVVAFNAFPEVEFFY
jgi:hypothetical protein